MGTKFIAVINTIIEGNEQTVLTEAERPGGWSWAQMTSASYGARANQTGRSLAIGRAWGAAANRCSFHWRSMNVVEREVSSPVYLTSCLIAYSFATLHTFQHLNNSVFSAGSGEEHYERPQAHMFGPQMITLGCPWEVKGPSVHHAASCMSHFLELHGIKGWCACIGMLRWYLYDILFLIV